MHEIKKIIYNNNWVKYKAEGVMNTLGFNQSVSYFLESGSANITNLKTRLNDEVDHTNLKPKQKDDLKNLIQNITDINVENQLSQIKNTFTLMTTDVDESENFATTISTAAKSLADVFNDYLVKPVAPSFSSQIDEGLGKQNGLTHFEDLINNFINIKPKHNKELSKILNEELSTVESGMRRLYPDLSKSQIHSIMSNIKLKLQHIDSAQNPEEILKGLKGIKVLIDHNLKSNKKLDWKEDEINLLFLNTMSGDSVAKTTEDQKKTNLDFIETCIKSPENHPEWCFFLNQAKAIFPNADESQIQDVFRSIMRATKFELTATVFKENIVPGAATVQREEQIIPGPTGFRETTEAEGSALRIREEAFKPQVKGQAISGQPSPELDPEGKKLHEAGVGQVYASAQQAVGTKTINPHYAEIFMQLKKLDQNKEMYLDSRPGIDPSTNPASLWSGNSQVSVYASEHTNEKYRTLEQSKLGKLFDSFEQYPDWKVQYPFWNLLSTGFVNAEISRQVDANQDPVVLHYNFRTNDPTTIGNLIEMPTAMYSIGNRKLELNLHPLITDTTKDGGMWEKAKIVINVNKDNFEQEFQEKTGKFRTEHMKELQDRKVEIANQLSAEVDTLAKAKVPTQNEITAELKLLNKPGGTLTADEETALKRKLVLPAAVAASPDSKLKSDWKLIQDNWYPIGEIESEPERIKKAKAFAAKK